MFKYNAKQWALIAGSFAIAAVLNWLIWLVSMGNPAQIDGFYHVLNIICLAAAFIVIGDRVLKTQIYK
jgi:hypothetical protein